MKKLLSAILAVLMIVSLAACTKPAEPDKPAEEGKVFNLWTWNDEFWGFLVKYYADEKVDDFTVKKGDVTIKRTTYVSDNMAYQDALDAALLAQSTAASDDKVDMFLAEQICQQRRRDHASEHTYNCEAVARQRDAHRKS